MRSAQRWGRTERRPQREGNWDHETDTVTNVSVDEATQGHGRIDVDSARVEDLQSKSGGMATPGQVSD
jgi:hypothetical protein